MFEQIQATMQVFADGLVKTQAMLKTVADMQAKAAEGQVALNASIESYIESAKESAKQRDEAIASYVASADARMKRLEANLDALIRAITAEHTNGKGKV